MEVFRSDSSGRDYANERLFNLLKRVKQNTLKDFFDNIERINDHKGTLFIHLKSNELNELNESDIRYYHSVFKTFWYLENEYEVEIVLDGKTVLL